MVNASAVLRRKGSAWRVRAAVGSILKVAGSLRGTLAAFGVVGFTRACVKPSQVSHKLNIWHVSQLWVVLQSTLDVLTLDWANANVLDLAVLQELAIVTVLELNDLMNVLRGWGCTILGHFLLLHGWLEWALWETWLKLRLLALLVSFAVVVRDFKDFFQALWRLHYALITWGRVFLRRCVVWVLTARAGRLFAKQIVQLQVNKTQTALILSTSLSIHVNVGTLLRVLASLHVEVVVVGAAILEHVKHSEAVVLVELERQARFFNWVLTITTLIVFIVVTLVSKKVWLEVFVQ